MGEVGFVSENWKAKSNVAFIESVLFGFVGLINLREVGAVVSIVILYVVAFVPSLPAVSFANIVKLWLPSGRPSRLNLAMLPDGVAVLFLYVPFGKPVCRKAVSGFASLNWKAKSKVELDEFVLFARVGLINLREVGDKVSCVMLML